MSLKIKVDELMTDVPVKNGMINYYELSHILKNVKGKTELKNKADLFK